MRKRRSMEMPGFVNFRIYTKIRKCKFQIHHLFLLVGSQFLMDFHSLYQLRKSIRNPNKKKKRESSNWNTFLLSYICWVPTYRVDRRSVGTNLNKCKKRNVLEDSGFLLLLWGLVVFFFPIKDMNVKIILYFSFLIISTKFHIHNL